MKLITIYENVKSNQDVITIGVNLSDNIYDYLKDRIFKMYNKNGEAEEVSDITFMDIDEKLKYVIATTELYTSQLLDINIIEEQLNDKSLIKYLNDKYLKIAFRTGMSANANISINTTPRELNINVDKLVGEPFYNISKIIKDWILHELRHFIDSLNSNNKIFSDDISKLVLNAYKFPSVNKNIESDHIYRLFDFVKKEYINKNKIEDAPRVVDNFFNHNKDLEEEYLDKSASYYYGLAFYVRTLYYMISDEEINARFVQVLYKTVIEDGLSKEVNARNQFSFLNSMMHQIGYVNYLKKEDQRRLYKKITATFNHYNKSGKLGKAIIQRFFPTYNENQDFQYKFQGKNGRHLLLLNNKPPNFVKTVNMLKKMGDKFNFDFAFVGDEQSNYLSDEEKNMVTNVDEDELLINSFSYDAITFYKTL